MSIIGQSHRLWLVAGAFALLPAVAEAQTPQARGVVRGRVVAQGTGAPVPEAQVQVVGTQIGARTDAQGDFTISGVPAGSQRVRALRIGYEAGVQTVTLAGGDTAVANFTLAPSAVQLSQVIVTATGEEVERRSQGINVSSIRTDTVQLAPIQNFSQLIQGRAAGVTISQSGGTTGSGATVRIRGTNSLNLSNEPLLVIDGVRVNSAAESNTIDVGGQYPSRLNDLNPEEIESIEILKGPAASALYGTAAANGVIQVTTKRGRAGETRWNTWLEYGTLDDVYDIPDNYGIIPAGGDESDVGSCILPDVAAGDCEIGSIARFNPLRNSEIFRRGTRQQYGLSVSGGGQQATYFLSGEFEDEEGIYATNEMGRVSLRANVETRPTETFRVGVQTGYLTSNLRQPQNDNNGNGILPQGLLGTPVNNAQGGFFAFAPEQTLRLRTEQGIRRFTGSTNAEWNALPWLSIVGTAGLDLLNRDETEQLPPNVFTDGSDIIGRRDRNRLTIGNYTLTGTATANYALSEAWAATSALGAQFLRQDVEGTLAGGSGVLEGTESLEGTTSLFEVGEFNQSERTIGFYGRQQFAFRDRLFLTASFRSDANSNFGENVGFVTYPQLEGSWVVNEEGFFPQTGVVNTLRLRAAWGQSGLTPTFRTAERFYTPAAVRLRNNEVVGFTFGGTGNPNLQPEVITELEGGFDIGLLNGRLGLEFTYYGKESQDALVSRTIAPSVGVSATRLENVGTVTNKGTEWLLSANLLQRENVAWDATVTYTTLASKLVSLKEGVDPIIFGLGGNSQRHEPGYAPGGYWATPYTYEDADGNGLLSFDEVTLGDEPVFVGSPTPTRELGFTTNVTLFDVVRLGALVDYRDGHKLYNATREFRCQFGTCAEINDPNASLEDQAVAIGLWNGTIYGAIEDASFVRLRELSLSLNLPSRYAEALRATGAQLTFAGRNLGLWTDYTGADPELNGSGQANFSRFEFFSQPPVRTFVARLQFTF